MRQSNRRIIAVLVALAAGFAVIATRSTQAQVAPVAPSILHYDSGAVAAGAVINSPVLYTLNKTSCEILADNSAGGSTRTLTVSWIAHDKTTTLETQTLSLTTGTRGAVNVAFNASSATQPTLMLTVPHAPGEYMSATLSAAGAAAGTLAVICR